MKGIQAKGWGGVYWGGGNKQGWKCPGGEQVSSVG